MDKRRDLEEQAVGEEAVEQKPAPGNSAIARINRLFASQPDSGSSLEDIIEEVRKAAEADLVFFYPYLSAKKKIMSPQIVGQLLSPEPAIYENERLAALAQTALSSGHPLFSDSSSLYTPLGIESNPDENRFEEHERVSSTATLPLRIGSESIGVLFINFRQPQRFDEAQRLFIETLGHYAAFVVDNSRQARVAVEESRRFRLLSEAGQELGKITDIYQLEQAYGIVIDKVVQFSNGEVTIRRYENVTSELAPVMVRGRRSGTPPLRSMTITQGINGRAGRELRTIVVHDFNRASSNEGATPDEYSGCKTLVVTPIIFENLYYGNLSLRQEKANSFSSADVNLLEGLARQLAVTIHRLELLHDKQEAERRAIEARMMSEVGKLAYEVTHQLGNDLPQVRSRLERIGRLLAKPSISNKTIEEHLGVIEDRIDRLSSLAKKLKVAAIMRVEGQSDALPELVTVQFLFEEVRRVLPEIPQNVLFTMEMAGDVGAVRVTPALIVEALYNLIINAIAAMPEGGRLTLRAANTGPYVELEVEDTGGGIAREQQEKIFNLFYTTKPSGSGFGLWSARLNVRQMGGDLVVRSEGGKGAVFTIRLPREPER